MLLAIFSDLHIDTWALPDLSSVFPSLPSVDGYVLAGDSGNGFKYEKQITNVLEEKYGPGISVKGNHDFYGEEEVKDYLDFQYTEVLGLKIVKCVLWTNFRGLIHTGELAQKYINDFRYIETFKKGLAHQRMTSFYEESRRKMLEVAEQGVDVVVTHFPPLILSEHPKYAGDLLNPYFVNNDPDLVEALSPRLWVHGHTHSKMDYVFKGVRVVANPIGYPGENQNIPHFEPVIVEV